MTRITKILSTIFCIVLFTTVSISVNAQNINTSRFASRSSDEAIDAFYKTFYNPHTKVYDATSELKGRAAIWCQAIFWDMSMNAYKRTGNKKHLDQINNVFEGAASEYDNYNWDNAKEWFIYDDIMWWVISLGRAYEITGEAKYLELSKSGFERVWNGSKVIGDAGSYDPVNGGMWWGWKSDQRGKMACICFPTIVAAMTLYNITHETQYREKAVEIYSWSRERLFDKKEGKIGDNMNIHNRVDWTTNLYNQATFIGAAVMLHKETKEELYLKDAILAADYCKNKMSDQNGILFFKNGIEQGVYAAIFSQYIAMLIDDCGQEQYRNWMLYNIDTAWKNRDKARNITFKDSNKPCPIGTIEVYDASGCPALMQVINPKKQKSKK